MEARAAAARGPHAASITIADRRDRRSRLLTCGMTALAALHCSRLCLAAALRLLLSSGRLLPARLAAVVLALAHHALATGVFAMLLLCSHRLLRFELTTPRATTRRLARAVPRCR